MPDPNGWNEWSKHVLKELERLNDCYEMLDKRVNKIHTGLAILNVKAVIWGAIAGLIPGSIVAIVWYLNKG